MFRSWRWLDNQLSTRSRLVLLCGVVYTFALLGLLLLNGELLVLALPPAIFLAYAVLQFPSKPEVLISRHLSAGRVIEGAEVEMEIRLQNQGIRSSLVEIKDSIPDGVKVTNGSSQRMLRLNPGEHITLRYSFGARRGHYSFTHLNVQAQDPLNLVSHSMQFMDERVLWVLPKVVPLNRSIFLHSRQTIGTAGGVQARLGGPGVSFYGVRNYQAGDELRWVNWKMSQRRPGEIFTNEFEQERAVNVGIILDVRQAAQSELNDQSFLEYSVKAAASLAQSLLAEGNRVGLMLYGLCFDWTYPGYGNLQRERILQSLARAHVGKSYALNNIRYLPTQLFSPRSQLIFVSPLLADDVKYLIHLRARGYGVLLVSPNHATFELNRNPDPDADFSLASRIVNLERKLMIRELEQAGVAVIDWDIRQSLDQTIHSNLWVLRRRMAGGNR